jgi:Domain of unknown function (DUF3806)
MSDATKTKTIETPNGPVTMTTKAAPSSPQQIDAASQDDITQFNASATAAHAFVQAYLPNVQKPTLEDFDEAFRRWQREGTRRYSEDQVIKMLGAYLGNRLVDDAKMEWVVVVDEYGQDYAVQAKDYEVVSFPFASVSKRIQKNEYGFMVDIHASVKHIIESGESMKR